MQGSATDVVRVKASITSGLRKTDFQIGQRGNEIKIVSSCQAWLSPGCGAETTVELPSGFPVVIRTTSGHVDVREVAEGVLTIVSGTGNISGTGLELDELSAETTDGRHHRALRVPAVRLQGNHHQRRRHRQHAGGHAGRTPSPRRASQVTSPRT